MGDLPSNKTVTTVSSHRGSAGATEVSTGSRTAVGATAPRRLLGPTGNPHHGSKALNQDLVDREKDKGSEAQAGGHPHSHKPLLLDPLGWPGCVARPPPPLSSPPQGLTQGAVGPSVDSSLFL